MRIATVLLLEDNRTNYQVVVEFNVEVMLGRDCCLPGSPTGGQCCVTQNLSVENQFEVNSSYLYGVVDLPGGPNMIQTHDSVGRLGYQFTTSIYIQSGDTALRKNDNSTLQPLRMFQFIVGEYRFTFVDLTNQTISSLVFQPIVLLIQLLLQHPHVPHPHLPLILPQNLDLLPSSLTLPQALQLHLPQTLKPLLSPLPLPQE